MVSPSTPAGNERDWVRGEKEAAIERTLAVARSYDAVADEYTRRIADELAHKPLDR